MILRVTTAPAGLSVQETVRSVIRVIDTTSFSASPMLGFTEIGMLLTLDEDGWTLCGVVGGLDGQRDFYFQRRMDEL